jgi:N-acetylmuramoyl-L-alanine amidase
MAMSCSTAIFGVNDCLNLAHGPIIVIDAGHGGHDGGASGKHYREKDLALQMALKLGAMIQQSYPQAEVIYTRTHDVFLPLYQRVDIANKKKADLFISIHCNYIANTHTKGTETYVMGLHKADENLRVAQRENEVILLENDFQSNYEGYDPNSPIGHIILSTFQDAYLEQSLSIAHKIEKGLASRHLSASRGVKQAGFAVLRRATMPSLLVETGFISNAEEERYLSSEEGQTEICQAITDGLQSLFENINPKESFVSNKPKIMDNEIVAAPQVVKKMEPEPQHAVLIESYQKIQFAALKNDLEHQKMSSIQKYGQVRIVEENGYKKYQVVGLKNEREVENMKKILADLGYASAFVVK